MTRDALVFVDLETTGLDPDRHEILEIAAIRADAETLEVEREVCLKVSPERIEDADPRALELCGYDEERWADAADLDEALAAVEPLMTGATQAGHHPSFDRSFLERAWAREGHYPEGLDYHLLDTVTLAWPLRSSGIGLDAVCRALGVRGDVRHRALPDARASLEVARRIFAAVGPIVRSLRFDAHLERARGEVSSWPNWKRGLLPKSVRKWQDIRADRFGPEKLAEIDAQIRADVALLDGTGLEGARSMCASVREVASIAGPKFASGAAEDLRRLADLSHSVGAEFADCARDLLGDRGPIAVTRSGTIVHLADPRPEEVVPEDLAHHLSGEPRYASATCSHYSVAQHCVLLSRWSRRRAVEDGETELDAARIALVALLHDAHEWAYKDVTAPHKALLDSHGAAYSRYADRAQAAVHARFGIDAFDPELLAEADRIWKEGDARICVDEMTALGLSSRCPNRIPLGISVAPWDRERTRAEYYGELMTLLELVA